MAAQFRATPRRAVKLLLRHLHDACYRRASKDLGTNTARHCEYHWLKAQKENPPKDLMVG